MSFFQENKFYLQNMLFHEMKGLDLFHRKAKYIVIQHQIRDRIKKSYSTALDKKLFYKEIIEILSDYESEYIYGNLFFENDCVDIVNYLIDCNAISNTLHFTDKNLGFDFYHWICLYKRITFNDLSEFIKMKFACFVKDLLLKDWYCEKGMEHPIVHKYINSLNNSFCDSDINSQIYSLQLFVKIWNYFPTFSSPFSNTEAIVLYNLINKNISLNTLNFLAFHSEIENFFKALFVEIVYIPFLDNGVDSKYSSGYLKQRNSFNERLNLIHLSDNTNENESYLELLKKIRDNPASILSKKCESIISEKIQEFCYPNEEELIQMRNLESNDVLAEVINGIFRRLYLFEYMFFE